MINVIEGVGQHKIFGIVTDSQSLQPLVQKWHKMSASFAPVCFNDPTQAKIWATFQNSANNLKWHSLTLKFAFSPFETPCTGDTGDRTLILIDCF